MLIFMLIYTNILNNIFSMSQYPVLIILLYRVGCIKQTYDMTTPSLPPSPPNTSIHLPCLYGLSDCHHEMAAQCCTLVSGPIWTKSVQNCSVQCSVLHGIWEDMLMYFLYNVLQRGCQQSQLEPNSKQLVKINKDPGSLGAICAIKLPKRYRIDATSIIISPANTGSLHL